MTAFTRFQRKNTLILYDTIGTLADSVGTLLNKPVSLVEKIRVAEATLCRPLSPRAWLLIFNPQFTTIAGAAESLNEPPDREVGQPGGQRSRPISASGGGTEDETLLHRLSPLKYQQPQIFLLPFHSVLATLPLGWSTDLRPMRSQFFSGARAFWPSPCDNTL